MMQVQGWVRLRMVAALVGAPALGARERAMREQAGQWMGIVEQPPETLSGADDAGVSPQGVAGLGGGGCR